MSEEKTLKQIVSEALAQIVEGFLDAKTQVMDMRQELHPKQMTPAEHNTLSSTSNRLIENI